MPGGTSCQLGFHASLFLPGCHSLCLYFWDGITWFPMVYGPACLCHFTTESQNTCKCSGNLQQAKWQWLLSKSNMTYSCCGYWCGLWWWRLWCWGTWVWLLWWQIFYKLLHFLWRRLVLLPLVHQSCAVVWVCFILNSRRLCWSGWYWKVNRMWPCIDIEWIGWVLPNVWFITYRRDLDERENLEWSSHILIFGIIRGLSN